MKKVITIFLSFILTVSILSGCSNNSDNTIIDSNNSYIDDTVSQSTTNTNENSDSGITADACSEGIYIKKDDLFYLVDTEVLYRTRTGMGDNINGIGLLETDNIPVFDKKSDKLAIFNPYEATYQTIKVLEKGYAFKMILDYSGKRFNDNYQIFFNSAKLPEGFDVLEGHNISDMDALKRFAENNDIVIHSDDDVLKDRNFMFSKSKKHLDAVYYEGTNSIKYTLDIDTPAVLLPEGPFDNKSLQRTDDGYAYLDLSQLDSGLYIINMHYGAAFGFDHCYLIEVK